MSKLYTVEIFNTDPEALGFPPGADDMIITMPMIKPANIWSDGLLEYLRSNADRITIRLATEVEMQEREQ